MISGAAVPNAKPLVCGIMLTSDRPEMASRALRCWYRQTYPNKRLFVLDTSKGPATASGAECLKGPGPDDFTLKVPEFNGTPIGILRNLANQCAIATFSPDIFVHWDDDDVSGPERIEQQVTFLEESGKECVGYREIYFLDQRDGTVYLYHHAGLHYSVGTSLCYTRRAYDLFKFAETGPSARNGSDSGFVHRLGGKMLALSCDGTNRKLMKRDGSRLRPPMFATLHDQTTNSIRQMMKSIHARESMWTVADEESTELVTDMFEEA